MEKQLCTVVTGGNRGIGRAVVLRMAKDGPVLFTARNEEQAKVVQQEVTKQGGTAEYCIGNVSDPELAKSALQKCNEKGWTPKNLILNAGVSSVAQTVSLDFKVWKEMFATNVDGALHFIQQFVPSMLTEKAGSICIMAGKAGVKAYRGMAAYSASKFALVGLAGALAEEFGSKGIKVVPVCPGPVDTDMTATVVDGLVKRGISKEDAVSKVAVGSGQKRLLTADEVAAKVAWVCSKEFTGENGKPLVITDESETSK